MSLRVAVQALAAIVSTKGGKTDPYFGGGSLEMREKGYLGGILRGCTQVGHICAKVLRQ